MSSQDIPRLNSVIKRAFLRNKVHFSAAQVGKTNLLLAEIEEFLLHVRATEESFGIRWD